MKYLSNFDIRSIRITHLTLLVFVFTFAGGCSVEGGNTSANSESLPGSNTSISLNKENEVKGATIPIDPNGPADTVRAFYKNLREKKFREAIFLTNLRPAIEGLTDTELKDFSLDFEALAGQVPAEIEINGEIISGDNATVTLNLPNDDDDKDQLQTLKLKRIADVWVIITVDDEAEARIAKEGKSYFYNLRIETHQEEAKKMLERISKAQLVYSLQNAALFTNMQTLISQGLLPDDIKTSESTGYNYVIHLAGDKKQYYATATPSTYGKSGKISFIMHLDKKGISRVTSKDNGGKEIPK